MRIAFTTLIVLIAIATNCSLSLAGKLGGVRDSVRKESKSESKKKEKKRKSRSSNNHDDHDHDHSDSSWLSFSLGLFEAQPTRSNRCEPTHHEPVYAAGPGVVSSASAVATAPTIASDDGWLGRLTILGGSDFDTLDHAHIAWLGQIPNSLGLDTSLTTFRESAPTFRDQLWLGDANLVFEPIFGDLRARIGLGFNWLHDSIGTEFGGNLTAGFDLALLDVLLLTGEVDTGALGDADFFHGQISVGYQIGVTELFAGYNYYDIGGAKLDGTMFGLRFRF